MLKNSKRTSKCQRTRLEYPKNPKFGSNWRAKRREPFGFFNIYSIAKYQKKWRGEGAFEHNKNLPKKVSQCRKLKGGLFGIFQHPFWRKISKNWSGEPLEKKNFRTQSLTMPKNTDRGTLVSASVVCFVKKGTTLIVQFPGPKGTIWRHKIL